MLEANAPRVIVVGGTSREAVLQLCRELSALSGFAIVAWCPQVDIDGLRDASKLPVSHVLERAQLAADRMYLVPADRRVLVERGQLVVAGPDHGPFDQLLRGVADAITLRAVGIVLAGHGTDGSLGIKRIKETGGLTIAERVTGDEAALPAAAIETGFIDLVLPLEAIAEHVAQIASEPPLAEDDPAHEADASDALRDILTLVRVRAGHDFSSYKRATLYRRIARRMQVCECSTLEAYQRYLRERPHELPHLLRDFLISVTNFFRDADSFEALAAETIPRMFQHKTSSDQVRVWVTGCATGEEAYSLGILLLEHAATQRSGTPIQIFATDIDEPALAEARSGLYSSAIASDVSPERLARFFTREGDQYRVTKELRELILFSPHNVLRDPPFSRLDLVSCRNLLIYLNREAQNRVLTMFHFGLRTDGRLFLGSSESAEGTSLFGVVDPKHRIFVRLSVPATLGDATLATGRWQPNIPVAT
ncbi:MAG TPA: CheR family methyltransferase, partial [Kofleriaceae bacterium]